MMLTPCCPNAGPTGGAGFACPAGICNLMIALTTLAMITCLWGFRIQNPEFFGYLLLHLISLIFSDIQGNQVNQVLENNVFAPDIPDFF
jgi:hypothetical protein